MTFDRSDLKAAKISRETDQQRALMPLTRMLQAAAPVMSHLMTESDAWNRYLGIVQGFVEQTKVAKMQAEARLSASDVWDANQLMKLKCDVLTCAGIIEALTVAISLPKALIEGGDAAKEIIRKFEAKNEQSA